MRLLPPTLPSTAAGAAAPRPAVFLDKDGTLIEDVPYNVDPALLRFTANAPEALRRLQAAGYLLIVISNQPGIARGRFDLPALQRLAAALGERLDEHGVHLDGFYACPHAPTAPFAAADDGVADASPLARAGSGEHMGAGERPRTPEGAPRGCQCRKPAPGLLLEAARDHAVDLPRSWMVGDILDDIEAGARAGCRTVHLDVGNETVWRRSPTRVPTHTTLDLLAAADAIITASPGRADGARPCRTARPPTCGRMTRPVGPDDDRNDAGGPVSTPEAPAGPGAWRQARRILVVRLDNLGDVLMTTPALTAIARAPGPSDRRLTLLTSRAGAVVEGRVPCLAEVMVYDAPWVQGAAGSGQSDRRFIGRLAQHRFDAAVVFTVATQSALPAALLCRLAGIPLRLAYSRENPYALLTDVVRDQEVCRDGMRHEVERQLDLVRSVGFGTEDAAASTGLVFEPTAADIEGARGKRLQAGLAPGAPYLVVHPGSTAASRRWPAERFGATARQIAATSGLQVVVAGGAGDIADAARVQAACGAPSVSLAGQLGIGELAALIAGARLVLCNNSGPAHLAAAVGTPVVVLYALTNPQHTPWRVPSRVLNHDVPCRNCLKSVCPQGHHLCLLGVEADAVAAAAIDLLRETGGMPAPPQRAATV